MSHDASFPFSDEDHYRRLRDRLIRFFAARGCYFTADLADDTLMRVWQSQARRPGDCSVDKWTFGVARNVLRESNRASRRTVQFDPDSHPVDAFQYTPATSKLELDLLPLKPSERALLHHAALLFDPESDSLPAFKAFETGNGVHIAYFDSVLRGEYFLALSPF